MMQSLSGTVYEIKILDLLEIFGKTSQSMEL